MNQSLVLVPVLLPLLACSQPAGDRNDTLMQQQEEPATAPIEVDTSVAEFVDADSVGRLPVPVLRHRVQLNPLDTAAHRGLASQLYREQRLEESLRAFRAWVEVDPTSTLAWGGLGTVAFELRMYDEAVIAFERMLEVDPAVFDNPFNHQLRRTWETALVRSGRRPPRPQ